MRKTSTDMTHPSEQQAAPLYCPPCIPEREERTAYIDLDAIEHNVRRLKELIGPRVLIAIVKADAYGHGAYPVARSALAAGADMLGLVHVNEALELRADGIEAPLIAWLHTPSTDFDAALREGVRLGVSGWDLEVVAAAAERTGERAIVHLVADTGLGRNGATVEEWPALVARAAQLEREGLVRVEGIFSHLAVADEPLRSETAEQLKVLEGFVARAKDAGLTPELVHLANSPATLTAALDGWQADESLLVDGVRCGLALYGLSPLPEVTSADLGLEPVMTVSSYIANVKEVPAGQGVSYGLRYHTEKPTTLALVPLGYADGVPRIAENAPVRIYPGAQDEAAGRIPAGPEGRTYQVVGRVAMDQMVVDLGEAGLSDPALGYLGAPVVLFGAGENPPVEEWAEAAQTINYEIVTRISYRVPRVYVGGSWVEAELDGLWGTETAETANEEREG